MHIPFFAAVLLTIAVVGLLVGLVLASMTGSFQFRRFVETYESWVVFIISPTAGTIGFLIVIWTNVGP